MPGDREDDKTAWAGMLRLADQGNRDRVLRMVLREARRAAGMTQVIAAQNIGWSVSKTSRIETGRVGLRVYDVQAALYKYEVNDKTLFASIIELARRARLERALAENDDA
jgi:transcriptional regulator with XRE-family HTH domain